MRVTISLACLLSCLSIQSALGQDLNRLRLLDYGDEQRPSRIRYEFIDTLHPLNFGRTTEYNQPPELSFVEFELIESSPHPYIPWLTTNWVAFGDKLSDSIENCSSQTETVPEEEEEVANERLLKQKLAEREKLAEEIERLRKLTGRPEQVVVQVRILEAPPDVMKELGLQGPYGKATKKTSGEDDDLIQRDGSLAKRIEKARSEKRLKVLATPSVVARFGRPATLMSGGAFPIILSQSEGKSGIEWREYGTRLEVVATNQGKGRTRLEISTEVSALDSTTSVSVAGQKVPGLTLRRSNSQVEIQLGETFVLAGMISTRESSSTREKQEIELVTLIRCDPVHGKKTAMSSD